MDNPIKYYIAKTRFFPYSHFYFTHIPTEGTEFPVINVVNPADYNISEVTKEEYELNAK